MYNYKIGYGSYEDSYYVELQHEECFTQEQLTEMIAEAAVELWDHLYELNSEGGLCRMTVARFFIQDDKYNIRDWLVEHKGFTFMDYQERWSIFGWYRLNEPDTWSREVKNDKSVPVILQALKEAGKV